MKIWKKFLSAVLAATMVLGVAACGEEGSTEVGGKGDDKVAVSAGSSAAKEGVYRLEELDFNQDKSETDSAVQKIGMSDDRIYVVLRTYNQNWESAYKLLSMNMDGSDMQSYALQTGEETEDEEADVSASDLSVEEELGYASSYESTSFSNFLFDDGYVYAQKSYYFEDYSDPENYISVNENYICCWDSEGNMLWETPVDILSGDENGYYYINAMAMLSNGNVVLLVSGDENGKIEVKSDGTVTDLLPVETLEDFFANPGYSVMMPDGRLLLTYYDKDWTDMSVVCYDFESDTINAPYPVPATMTYNGMANLCVDEAGDMLYSNSDGVYKYHIGDEAPTRMMSFVNSDMTISYLDAFLPLSEDQFLGVYSKYDETTYMRSLEGGIFTKVNPEDIPDKEILVLGGNYISSDIKERVVEYNKQSDTYRIVLKDYNQYNTGEDYMAGYTQLNNDIIAGNMPDILITDSYNMTLENYVSKGLLADIGELMANDSELSGMEYMDNVFEACKVDGKLYEIVPAFYVSTYVGKTSLLGDRTSWTMEEALQILEEMPEGTSLFGEMTRDSFFNIVMEQCGRDFVDVSTGKCSFDSEEFISLMEFAKTLPEEMGDGMYDEDWYNDYESQYREDRTLLSNCYISSLDQMVYTINGSFGEAVSYVGMPTSSGQGSVIYTPTTYALSAQSKHLDAAWEFMRYYLTEEYQETIEWQLPVAKKQFDEMAQKATRKPVYEDGEGNQIEEDYTYWINDESIILDPLTQEQVAEITEFISTITTKAYYNTEVNNIISEEMAAFYQDQKKAEDVASIIQSRVQIYVNENR